MDALISNLSLDAFQAPDLSQLLQGATSTFLAFVLVVTRMTGLVVLGPVFGHPGIPVRIRVFLVLAISLVITPTLVGTSREQTFRSLDRNHDGELTVEEVPHSLAAPVARLIERSNTEPGRGLKVDDFFLTLPAPQSLIELAWLMLVEFALGIALGLGVSTIVSGLQLAGSLIDAQIGTSLGSVFNPEFQTDSSLSGEALHQLALAVFLIAGGHKLMISTLVDTFQTMPVGYAWVSAGLIELLSEFVHQSLALAVQVSAPVMATMALVGLAMGFLGHTIPQLNVLVVGFPVRTLVGLFLLGLIVPAVAEALARVLPAGIEQLRQVLTGGAG
ncbi:MAG: flagellar biosynthetic protein FliR [Planctomycetia bacterium]|nr:flagellar biosynthetic protein FliR [Planctomycetia bacterium]